ncbi:MAG: bacillithiol biosynthesis BshC, partial [Bacteroidota bacterium]
MPSHSYAGLSQFSLLAQTYVSDYARVAPYYAGDFADPTARAAVAEHAAGHTRDRDLLVEVLLDQNAAWGIDEATKTNIERLLDPESVA